MRDQYRSLYDDFRWHVPREFNIAEVCCRRWSQETSRIALHYEDEHGNGASYTYAALQSDANRLSNALQSLGIRRGDRVAIVLPQSPETTVAHVAIYQMGAVAMPLSLLFGPDALEYRLHDSDTVVAIIDAGGARRGRRRPRALSRSRTSSSSANAPPTRWSGAKPCRAASIASSVSRRKPTIRRC